MPRPSSPSAGAAEPTTPDRTDRNVAVGSHNEYVSLVTAVAT